MCGYCSVDAPEGDCSDTVLHLQELELAPPPPAEKIGDVRLKYLRENVFPMAQRVGDAPPEAFLARL